MFEHIVALVLIWGSLSVAVVIVLCGIMTHNKKDGQRW